ncbi:DUF488 domain-containing protein [Methanocella arvoryzae]|uniref:DUF488 domain-containing protein n=1 Tax=Methanocella arvoryzae (strain DSM 22066 / NBRC 105507 / MRE50) TaxID=351160 RepID=Q0W466_METAR|nr:DUF488 domain-containing protein [Methanocella arvoryzae]CAJ36827.1 hypothetical protein RCIX1578 [Methanocella arvoryzae MRE50]
MVLTTEKKRQVQSKLGALGSEPDFYTVGYERLSLEDLFLLLKDNGVHCLVDVREAPWSQVPDYRKAVLGERLPELSRFYGYEIQYVSMPSVGNVFRKNDLPDKDINESYRRHIVSKGAELEALHGLITQSKTALMCYEADPKGCHRSILASVLAGRYDLTYVDLRELR